MRFVDPDGLEQIDACQCSPNVDVYTHAFRESAKAQAKAQYDMEHPVRKFEVTTGPVVSIEQYDREQNQAWIAHQAVWNFIHSNLAVMAGVLSAKNYSTWLNRSTGNYGYGSPYNRKVTSRPRSSLPAAGGTGFIGPNDDV